MKKTFWFGVVGASLVAVGCMFHMARPAQAQAATKQVVIGPNGGTLTATIASMNITQNAAIGNGWFVQIIGMNGAQYRNCILVTKTLDEATRLRDQVLSDKTKTVTCNGVLKGSGTGNYVELNVGALTVGQDIRIDGAP